jgi:hypothetical protein
MVMGTVTDTRPEIGTEPPQPPPRRKHPGRWVALGLALILVAGFVFLVRYRPLGASFTGHTDTTYRQGRPFSYILRLTNHGPLPVRIEGIDFGSAQALVRETSVMITKDPMMNGATYSPSAYELIHPFTLSPGSSRAVLVLAVFDNCSSYAPGTASGFGSVHVYYSTLGVARTTWLDYGDAFEIQAPNTCTQRP